MFDTGNVLGMLQAQRLRSMAQRVAGMEGVQTAVLLGRTYSDEVFSEGIHMLFHALSIEEARKEVAELSDWKLRILRIRRQDRLMEARRVLMRVQKDMMICARDVDWH